MAGPVKVNLTHEKLAEALLAAPRVTQRELAALFGYSETWISLVVRSAGFREYLAERKLQLVDPKLSASIEERIEALAQRSADVLIEQLDIDPSFDKALAAMKVVGPYAVQQKPQRQQVEQVNYVVALPPVAKDSGSWLSSRQGQVVDVVPSPAPAQ